MSSNRPGSAFAVARAAAKARTSVIENRKKHTLQSQVHAHVEAGAALYTDELLSYDGLAGKYAHEVIDHAVRYVDGEVHTNGLENYWSLLKRSISGTYVSVEPFHLFRYLDEQAYRYNNRKDATDFDRFKSALAQIVCKRLDLEASDRNAGRRSMGELKRNASANSAGNDVAARFA
jgi:transposase-like protein